MASNPEAAVQAFRSSVQKVNDHEVLVYIRRNDLATLRQALSNDPLTDRLNLVIVDTLLEAAQEAMDEKALEIHEAHKNDGGDDRWCLYCQRAIEDMDVSRSAL